MRCEKDNYLTNQSSDQQFSWGQYQTLKHGNIWIEIFAYYFDFYSFKILQTHPKLIFFFFILLQNGFESLTSKERTAQWRAEAIHAAGSIGTENATEIVFVGSHGLCIAAVRSRISKMRVSAGNPSRVATNTRWTTITIFGTTSLANCDAIVYKLQIPITVDTSGSKWTVNLKATVGSVQDDENCGNSDQMLHISHFSVSRAIVLERW